MASNKIITIGRQFGSGGREVGQKNLPRNLMYLSMIKNF